MELAIGKLSQIPSGEGRNFAVGVLRVAVFHTHGGQVRLPIIGAMQLPMLGKKYVEGHFQFGKLQLYVNRGLGTVGIPFRFDCPPEITLHTLLPA